MRHFLKIAAVLLLLAGAQRAQPSGIRAYEQPHSLLEGIPSDQASGA